MDTQGHKKTLSIDKEGKRLIVPTPCDGTYGLNPLHKYEISNNIYNIS